MGAVGRVPWGAVAAAGGATLVGNGLARFGYAPLLPAVITAGWFAPGPAAYLGAANLLGYVLGALAARSVAGRFGMRRVLQGGMLAAALSLLACGTPLAFAWFFAWRLVSGIAGGLLMILAPSAVLPHVPADRRGLASGLIFTGVGLGIAASGTLVPLLLRSGLPAAWLGLGGVSLAVTMAAWGAWPAAIPVPSARPALRRPAAISLSYGLCAVGLVPHMVFLADFVARGQGRGLAAGSLAWVLFGAGALCGAVVVGRLADRVGATAAMRMIIAAALAAVLSLAFLHTPLASGASAVIAGVCASGLMSAMLGRVQDAAGADPAARQQGWTEATLAWAIGQATAAYGLAWLYARTGGYGALLATAAGSLLLAALNEAAIALGARRPRPA